MYRSGIFEISNADGVQPGTKIIIHLKPDSREFSDENTINRKHISNENIHTFVVLCAFM